MYNSWHELILSQQASNRWQLAGGGKVQVQLSHQAEDFYVDIMNEWKRAGSGFSNENDLVGLFVWT